MIFALNSVLWWELARWNEDSWMMEALYNLRYAQSVEPNGLQNTSDDVIMNLVMGTMVLGVAGVG